MCLRNALKFIFHKMLINVVMRHMLISNEKKYLKVTYTALNILAHLQLKKNI